MTLFPEILWAQRSDAKVLEKNVLYLTVNVSNIKKDVLELTSTHFKFKGSDGENEYAVEFDFFAEIDAALSQEHTTGRGIFLVLRKAEAKAEYWPRLTKDKVRKPYIKTDFERWVDEDEQDVKADGAAGNLGGGMGGGMGDFDFSSLLNGAGGTGGAGGLDFSKMGDMAGLDDGNDELGDDNSPLGDAEEEIENESEPLEELEKA